MSLLVGPDGGFPKLLQLGVTHRHLAPPVGQVEEPIRVEAERAP